MKKRHLVTGVTSGMGRAIAAHFRGQGDQVVGVLRHESQAAQADVDEAIFADLADPASVGKQFDQLKGTFDSFINCAGLSMPKSFREQDAEGLQTMMNVNLISPILMTKHMAPRLNEGGTIVLFGSQSALKGSYDDAYAAGKAGIHAFVKSTAPKLAPRNRILHFAPGIVVPTRMTSGQMSPELLEKKRNEIPMKSFGTPQEIAEIVYFLLSDSCRFMTGATIDVNGGMVLR